MVKEVKKQVQKKKSRKQARIECPECAELKNKWLRACADYENFRKETEINRSKMIKMSEIEILSRFLPVFDNFTKAFADKSISGEHNKNWQNWKRGIAYIMKQFEDVLEEMGVEKVNCMGQKFDPNIHEAVGEEESDKFASGVVIRELESGYKKDDLVIRAAKVIVAK